MYYPLKNNSLNRKKKNIENANRFQGLCGQTKVVIFPKLPKWYKNRLSLK